MSIFEQLAESYERVASLPDVNLDAGGRISGKPGSRVPPGAAELLDADEYDRAVKAVDTYAEFVIHVLIDEVPGVGSVPDETPGRLRVASRWARELKGLPVMLHYAVWADGERLLWDLKRIDKRGTRQVHTKSACLDITCSGEYVAQQKPDEERDWTLKCDGCGDEVPSHVFERWSSRSQWVTPERVMTILGLGSRQAVYHRASREGWRRQGDGKEIRYHVQDVEGRTEMSA